MKKKTIGILATSVAVGALCLVTDVSAFAGHGVGVAAADMAVEVVGMAVGVAAAGLPCFTAGAADGIAEAAGFMALLPMVPRLTLVMDGVALMPFRLMHSLVTQ